MPQPMVVFYGQAKDQYGWPYLRGAEVILRVGTNEIIRHTIDGSLSHGVNFALRAPIDDGRDSLLYFRHALTTGAVITIVVSDSRGERTIMEHAFVPHARHPGEIILVNVTAGLDSDGDGLPDEWEQELVDWGTNPDVTSIADIDGLGDYDGDRQSNADEYRAGTFAFLDYDYFFAERLAMTANGRLRLEFLSVPGIVYAVQSSTNLVADPWVDCEYSPSESGELQTGPFEGHGGWMSFYVPVPDAHREFRLQVR